MSVGISKTLEVVACARDAALEMVALYKDLPFTFLKIAKFVSIATQVASDVQTIAADAQLVFPELTDLDAGEVSQLTASVYQAALDVVKALKA